MDILEQFENNFPLLRRVQQIENVEAELNEILRLFRIPRRIFRDQENPLEYYRTEKEFKEKIGFSKDGFRFLFDIFKNKLERPFNPGSPTISPLLRLTIFLWYLKHAEFYNSMTDQTLIKLPKSTIGDIVNVVAKDIATFSSKYIVFPDEEEKEVIAKSFLEQFNFPGCIGIFGNLY